MLSSFQVKNSTSSNTDTHHSLPANKPPLTSVQAVPTSKSMPALPQQQHHSINRNPINTVTNNYEILEYNDDQNQNHNQHHLSSSSGTLPSQYFQNTLITNSNTNTIQSSNQNTSNIATIEYDANTIEVYSYRDDNVVYVEEKKQLAPPPPLPLHLAPSTLNLPPVPLVPLSTTNNSTSNTTVSCHSTPAKQKEATTTFCEVVKTAVGNTYESSASIVSTARLIPAQTYNFQNIKYLIDINDLKNHLTSNYDNTTQTTKSSASVSTLDKTSKRFSFKRNLKISKEYGTRYKSVFEIIFLYVCTWYQMHLPNFYVFFLLVENWGLVPVLTLRKKNWKFF
jgi:hypothetical protein